MTKKEQKALLSAMIKALKLQKKWLKVYIKLLIMKYVLA